MRRLLDVNVLLALGLADHGFHARVVRWLQREARTGNRDVATCSITELAFIRISTQAIYGYSVGQAKSMLDDLKRIKELDFAFLSDDQPGSHLPEWVVHSSQVTDGHLCALAKRHRAVLATLDEGIANAVVIPR